MQSFGQRNNGIEVVSREYEFGYTITWRISGKGASSEYVFNNLWLITWNTIGLLREVNSTEIEIRNNFYFSSSIVFEHAVPNLLCLPSGRSSQLSYLFFLIRQLLFYCQVVNSPVQSKWELWSHIQVQAENLVKEASEISLGPQNKHRLQQQAKSIREQVRKLEDTLEEEYVLDKS